MTQAAITLPYLRTSMVHVPRRDLVFSASDSLYLNIAVVESDHPNAQALILTTDEDGPSMQLVLWREIDQWGAWGCDYGRPGSTFGTVLSSTSGVPGEAAGSWDFHLPTGTFADFPLRCGWSVLLLWDGGTKSSVLARGIAHVMRPLISGVPLAEIPPVIPPIIPPTTPSNLWLTTDSGIPIITSDTAKQLETS